MENEIAPRAAQFDLSPQTFDQALAFSGYLADSDLVPKDFKGKPGNCLVAMQWGSELGLKPLQAMQNLAIINGRPSLWGDAVIALVRGSGLCEYVIEEDSGTVATCKVKRRGEPEESRSFSIDDAKTAGLFGKAGPWTQYPKRMRQMRARAFALRDVFPDVLRGLPVAEELMDTPVEKHLGAAEVVKGEAAAVEVVHYAADQFTTNLPRWTEVIQQGRKTADDLIAFAVTRGTPYTDEQIKKLRAIKAVEPTGAAGAAATDVVDKNEPPAPAVTFAMVADRLHAATTQEELTTAAEQIGEVASAEQRAELTQIHNQRVETLPPF